MVLNNQISDFEVTLRNIDDITIHYRNIQTLSSERKTTAFYGLFFGSPIMSNFAGRV